MSLVGKQIDAFCSRCGFMLAHTVLYEVAGAVVGVQCRTCGADHRYRGPAPKPRRDMPAIRQGGISAAAPKPKAVRPADARQWETLNAATAPEAVFWDYRWTERYQKGELINHARFGRGFVQSVAADEMEVLFREGRKRLAMNRPETLR